ncbi:MAG: TonB-dependent receptor [Saprospiraceae bacterium]
MKNLFTTLVLLIITISLAQAQKGGLRGKVLDKESGEVVLFSTVRLEGTEYIVNSNIDGFYSFSNIPAGKYNAIVSYVGYDSLVQEVTITNSQVYKDLFIAKSTVELGAVEVTGKKEQARTEVQISKVTVTPKQIKQLPSTGGEPDIAQYLPVLPGVIFTGDQGGQLYIRGGSPVQNKVLLDGMTIYNPFHSIGFYSVFETETIRSIDVLTGGFNAEYGGRISAILDLKTRDGNKKRFGGIISTSPFQSKILLEGPIIKLKEDGNSPSASFLVTGKTSYIDKTSKTLYSYAAPDSVGLPYNFTDLYAKTTFATANGTKLNLFGFKYDDRVNYSDIADLNWNSFGGGGNFSLIPSSTKMIVNGNFAFSRYKVSIEESDDSPRSSAINNFVIGLNFSLFNNNSETKYGFEVNGIKTEFAFTNFLGLGFNQTENTTEVAGYINHRHKFGNLVIEPSIRLQYYASLAEISPEPRFGLKYNITDFLRFKAAGGLYSQNLISTVNERDIVNLFVGFLTGPEESFKKLNSNENAKSKLQRSIHGVAGFEYDLTTKIELNAETYYKHYPQLINVNRNKILATDPNYATETGDAYGIDLTAKYETKQWYMWGTYSLAYVKRDDGEQVYPTNFDRRHNINALVSYTFGKNSEWELGARWNFGTGFPFTLTQGFYSYNTFDQGINSNILTNNPQLGIIYSDKRNSGRLPYYHRLDMSLKRTFEFTKYSNLEVNLSITNTYNRNNIFYFDRIKYKRVDQLPILPSLGLKFTF